MGYEKIRKKYTTLTEFLIKNHLSITTMESATSGLLASLITDTPGASAILKGAFVTYSNEAKIQQGVNPQIIEKYSVYSKETAQEMAKVCQKAYNSDVAIGVTGTMGNLDPANLKASVPGQVYFAIAKGEFLSSYFVQLEPQPTRYDYKMAVAKEVIDKLFEILKISE